MGVREERFLGRLFNDQEKHSQKAPDEQHIQPASQRQRHGGRGRADRRLAVASRARARGPRAPACGRAQMLPLRKRHRGYDQGGGVRRWRGQDFGLLARRTGRRHAARGLPEVRRRGRLRAVGGTGQPVHQGFRVFCFNVCSTGSAVFFRSVG